MTKKSDPVANAKPIARLLEAVRDVIDRDVALKLYGPEDLRLTIESRKKVAQALIAGGASEREAAQALGVHQATIRRDLGKDKTPSSDAKSIEDSVDSSIKTTVSDAKSI